MALNKVQNVKVLVQRLLDTGRTFQFFNRDKTLRFTLRASMIRKKCVFIELRHDMDFNAENVSGILYQDNVEEIDEDRVELVAHWHVNVVGSDVQYIGVMDKLNECLRMNVCDCGCNFVYDADKFSECFHCILFKEPIAECDRVHCEICARDGHKESFCTTSCCAQNLHTACLAKCERRCPFCRHLDNTVV